MVNQFDRMEYVEHLQSVLNRDRADTSKLTINRLSKASFAIHEYWAKMGFLDLFWERILKENEITKIIFSLEIGLYGADYDLPEGFEMMRSDGFPLEYYWVIAVLETKNSYLLARWSSDARCFTKRGEFLIERDSSRQVDYVKTSKQEVTDFTEAIDEFYSHLFSTNIFDYPLQKSKHLIGGSTLRAFAFFSVNYGNVKNTVFVPEASLGGIQGNDIEELECFLDRLVSRPHYSPWLCKGETWEMLESERSSEDDK